MNEILTNRNKISSYINNSENNYVDSLTQDVENIISNENIKINEKYKINIPLQKDIKEETDYDKEC